MRVCVRACGACVRAYFTGLKADFSTANPTSAYDTSNFGKVSIFNKDVLKNPITGEGPEIAGKKTLEAAAAADTYASRSLSNFARWRRGEATDDTRRFDLQQTAKDKKK